MYEKHTGPLMPETKDRDYAYEDEFVSRPVVMFTARHNDRRGRKELTDDERAEREAYDGYELTIKQLTGTSLEITLRKRVRDIVWQRKAGGKVVTHDCYQRSISFAELVNLLFATQCFHFEEQEHYPESIHEAMKTAYRE